MILFGLFAAIAFAPIYWLAVPARWRREVITALSMAALAAYDARLAALLAATLVVLALLVRAILVAPEERANRLALLGLLLLAVLFTINKLVGGGLNVLPSQTGLAFLGISYLVLKAAALLVDLVRQSVREVSLFELVLWIVFLPTYPSGPMEEFEHFQRQRPRFERRLVFGGLERILFGLVKSLVVAHQLGEWLAPVFAAPQQYGRLTLLAAAYAFILRFYYDFAGYSDMAIGLSALYGYDVVENFDRPLLQRNLVQLWQRWHMTLTRFLRVYIFIPVGRRLMRPRGPLGARTAIFAGQLAAMIFCGLWHGFSLNFALWGITQAIGLVWVGTFARDAGRLLPPRLLRWWRHHPLGYAAGVALTFNYFALTSLFTAGDATWTLGYLAALFGP
jgi:alginate O-acetyltransferase complex protein AlgI